MRKIIFSLASMLLILTLSLSIVASAKTIGFKDIVYGEYYYDAVLWAVGKEITTGTSDTTFSPNEGCTRAQTVTFLWRAAGKPEPTTKSNPFIDIKENDYFYKAVLWASEKGVTTGTSEKTFSPNDLVTREQFVTFLWRNGGKVSSNAFNYYTDVKKGEYYYEAVLWAFNNNITKGTTETTFGTGETCTRGQTVTFLYRDSLDKKKVEATPKANPVSILKIDGKDISLFTIVYDNNGGVMENAANQLQRYIKEATGIEITVSTNTSIASNRIYIKDNTVLGTKEGYKYYSDDKGIVIEGSYLRGALYGVYNFLEEQVGWRYLTPDFETCLEADEINLVNLNESYKPYIENRNSFWAVYLVSDNSSEFAAKRMLNDGFARHTTVKDGGMDGFVSDTQAHTIGYLSGTGGGTDTNPCLSDESVYQSTKASVIKWLNGSSRKIISVSQNDTKAHCTCNACNQKEEYYGSPAGAWIEFVNRLATELHNDYPDVLIQTLAYEYTLDCPVNITCHPNVMVEICTTTVCANHDIDDKSCPANKEFSDNFEAWSEICQNLSVWDYTTLFRYNLAPHANFNRLLASIRYFDENNVTNLFSQGNGNTSGEFGALRAYMVSKCMENPYMSNEEYESLLVEFLQLYYGQGWDSIYQFLNLYQSEEFIDADAYYTSFTLNLEEEYKDKIFGKYNDLLVSLWDKAEELADDEVILSHVKQSRICCDYMRLGAIFKEFYKGTTEQKEYIMEQNLKLYNLIKDFDTAIGDNDPVPKMQEMVAKKTNCRTWGQFVQYKG